MKDERKQIRAINESINRIAIRPLGKMSNSDLEILMLQRIDDRLRELIRTINKQNMKQVIEQPDRPTAVEPKKRKRLFAFIKG